MCDVKDFNQLVPLNVDRVDMWSIWKLQYHTHRFHDIKCHLTSIRIPTVEIRRSYDRLICTVEIPILVMQHLYTERVRLPLALLTLCSRGTLRSLRAYHSRGSHRAIEAVRTILAIDTRRTLRSSFSRRSRGTHWSCCPSRALWTIMI